EVRLAGKRSEVVEQSDLPVDQRFALALSQAGVFHTVDERLHVAAHAAVHGGHFGECGRELLLRFESLDGCGNRNASTRVDRDAVLVFAETARLVIVLEAEADRIEDRVAVGACRVWLERSEEHTSELQSRENLVCRLLLEKKKK